MTKTTYIAGLKRRMQVGQAFQKISKPGFVTPQSLAFAQTNSTVPVLQYKHIHVPW